MSIRDFSIFSWLQFLSEVSWDFHCKCLSFPWLGLFTALFCDFYQWNFPLIFFQTLCQCYIGRLWNSNETVNCKRKKTWEAYAQTVVHRGTTGLILMVCPVFFLTTPKTTKSNKIQGGILNFFNWWKIVGCMLAERREESGRSHESSAWHRCWEHYPVRHCHAAIYSLTKMG